MKKALSLVLLTGLMLASSVPAFAAEETNLPYVEGLGYEVEVFEEDYTQPKLFSYDSGWKSFLGGKWRHGVGSRYVWSKYDHNDKTHKTTVQGAGGKFSYSGWTRAGSRAEASWEKALSGNRAWADVK
ncbi:TPA: lactococcin 972 family bacteriocin [Streptococcus agalactiae]|jgi:putative bacteriocin